MTKLKDMGSKYSPILRRRGGSITQKSDSESSSASFNRRAQPDKYEDRRNSTRNSDLMRKNSTSRGNDRTYDTLRRQDSTNQRYSRDRTYASGTSCYERPEDKDTYASLQRRESKRDEYPRWRHGSDLATDSDGDRRERDTRRKAKTSDTYYDTHRDRRERGRGETSDRSRDLRRQREYASDVNYGRDHDRRYGSNRDPDSDSDTESRRQEVGRNEDRYKERRTAGHDDDSDTESRRQRRESKEVCRSDSRYKERRTADYEDDSDGDSRRRRRDSQEVCRSDSRYKERRTARYEDDSDRESRRQRRESKEVCRSDSRYKERRTADYEDGSDRDSRRRRRESQEVCRSDSKYKETAGYEDDSDRESRRHRRESQEVQRKDKYRTSTAEDYDNDSDRESRRQKRESEVNPWKDDYKNRAKITADYNNDSDRENRRQDRDSQQITQRNEDRYRSKRNYDRRTERLEDKFESEYDLYSDRSRKNNSNYSTLDKNRKDETPGDGYSSRKQLEATRKPDNEAPLYESLDRSNRSIARQNSKAVDLNRKRKQDDLVEDLTVKLQIKEKELQEKENENRCLREELCVTEKKLQESENENRYLREEMRGLKAESSGISLRFLVNQANHDSQGIPDLLAQLVERLDVQGVRAKVEVWTEEPHHGHNAVVLVPVVASSRLMTDVGNALSKSKLESYEGIVLIIFHHLASHNRIRVPTRDKYYDRSLVQACRLMADAVFWQGMMSDCRENEILVNELKQVSEGL